MEKNTGLTKAERGDHRGHLGGQRPVLHVIAHGAIVRIRSKNPRLSDQLAVNYRRAEITARQRAMLDYAMKVALRSAEVSDEDFAALRAMASRSTTSGTSAPSLASTA